MGFRVCSSRALRDVQPIVAHGMVLIMAEVPKEAKATLPATGAAPKTTTDVLLPHKDEGEGAYQRMSATSAFVREESSSPRSLAGEWK